MIKVQIGWDDAIVTIPVEIASGKIRNHGVLAEVFDTVLSLIDPDYLDADDIQGLFQEALGRLEEIPDVTSD